MMREDIEIPRFSLALLAKFIHAFTLPLRVKSKMKLGAIQFELMFWPIASRNKFPWLRNIGLIEVM